MDLQVLSRGVRQQHVHRGQCLDPAGVGFLAILDGALVHTRRIRAQIAIHMACVVLEPIAERAHQAASDDVWPPCAATDRPTDRPM